MKVFIDLGAFNGDTLIMAMNKYKDVDLFYAFEPFPKSFEIMKRHFINNDKVKLYQAAAGVKDEELPLFLKKKSNAGHSLLKAKKNVSKRNISVRSIDFSRFVIDTFAQTDYIVLKINIEGAEYSLLQKMMDDKSIDYINELYCEWHAADIGCFPLHNKIICSLNALGFPLSGDNKKDDFVHNV